VNPEKGVMVVAPQGFDQKQLPAIVQEHRQWIEQAIQRMKRRAGGGAKSDGLPPRIDLLAIEEQWAVEYRPSASEMVGVRELPGSRLAVSGAVTNHDLCYEALRRWLMRRANTWLERWALDVAADLGLPCQQVTVRNQKTRLGSCTSSRHLSLNAKLLFFPEAVVHYVLVHELCHLLQMNHSPAFWKEVEKREPNYRRLRLQARTSWRKLPAWSHAPQ
jgi:predicted metal-dependent hydrolase